MCDDEFTVSGKFHSEESCDASIADSMTLSISGHPTEWLRSTPARRTADDLLDSCRDLLALAKTPSRFTDDHVAVFISAATEAIANATPASNIQTH